MMKTFPPLASICNSNFVELNEIISYYKTQHGKLNALTKFVFIIC